MAKKRSFADIKYKTYDTSAGYGNVSEWQSAWNRRMGTEEATRQLGSADPLSILGFEATPTLDELKRRYRKLMLQYHPDAGGTDPAKAASIIAAYSLLEEQLNPR